MANFKKFLSTFLISTIYLYTNFPFEIFKKVFRNWKEWYFIQKKILAEQCKTMEQIRSRSKIKLGMERTVFTMKTKQRL